MASNNNTEVVNGVVQPRFYQVYGDLIESKEIMEPLAIGVGTGPICGFDWVDTSKTSVTITSIFKSNSDAKGLSMLKGKSRRVFLSDKNNNAGQVFNAYTTPDGLCHIAPDTLTFNSMQPDGGWPSTTNPTKLVSFIVKASHTYRPNNSENPPSLANFTCNWVDIDSDMPLSNILSWNYQSILDLLSSNSIKFDSNTEVIIGLYLVGWRSSWNNSDPQLKDIMASINYTLCLVPTEGRFPVSPWISNPFDILIANQKISTLEKYLSQVLIGKGSIQIKGTGSNIYVFVHYSKMGLLNLSITLNGDNIGNDDNYYGLISNYDDFGFEWYSQASDPTISIKSLFQVICKYYSGVSLLEGNPCRYVRCNMISPTSGAKLIIQVTASDIHMEVSKIGDRGNGVGNFAGDFTFLTPYSEVSTTLE